jgi:CRISPR/Cas system-associated protein Cas10 (large subunit of type III CRISPR-Cas system)
VRKKKVDLDTLRICALLHDVGKPACWAHYGEDIWRQRHTTHGHVYYGEEIISECLGEKGKAIALVARRHHNNRHFPEDCPVEDSEHIVHKADWLASNADRPEGRKGKRFSVRLSHPLSHIDAPIPISEFGKLELLGISKEIMDIVKSVARLIGVDNKKAFDELYAKLCKSGINRVPADTGETKNDHTLWDHSRLTAALATCIYLDSQFKGKRDTYKDYNFAFLGGDTDRVGEFIHQSRRLPDLVARSNIAKVAVEKAVTEIGAVLGPECVIYEGGGNFLVLAPLSKVKELEKIGLKSFNEVTEERLSITMHYCNKNGSDIAVFPYQLDPEKSGFNVVWSDVFKEIRAEKRTKPPRHLHDSDLDRRLCDVCLEEPATVEDPHHPYWIVEDGVRRRERLCARCHSLRDGEWKAGVWLEKYVDKETGLTALFKIDGDDVGDIIEGTMLREKYKKRASPARLSSISRLIDSTCRMMGEMVVDDYEGRCIYAAGDDLLGVVKGSQGLKCVKELTDFFIKQMAGKVTMSAGMVVMKADFPIYIALEALEQLLKNAKDYREKGDVSKMGKANIDFEVIYNIGLTKGDFELEQRVKRHVRHLSHRPCKIRDLNELFRMLSFIESSRVSKSQASFLTTILASQPTPEFSIPEENLKRASVVAKSLMGRGHIDMDSGKFLLRSIDNGIVCDAYLLATRLYRKEGITSD